MVLEQVIMTIITFSGDARSSSMEAIAHAKSGETEKAKACIDDATEKLGLAHKEQTSLIRAEASGENVAPSLLLIHAQDHLMTAMTMKDLANEFVDMYERINSELTVRVG